MFEKNKIISDGEGKKNILNLLFKINSTCIFGQSEEVIQSGCRKSTTIYMYWTSKTTLFFCNLTCISIQV